MPVSGVHRGEQRKLYDQRQRDVLPKYGITLAEISYKDFQFDTNKKIVRIRKNDLELLKVKLQKWIKTL